MYAVAYYTAALLASLYYALSPAPRVVERVVYKKDPSGLTELDIRFIEANIPSVHWKPGDDITDVAYRQGQHALLQFIRTRVIGRESDGLL